MSTAAGTGLLAISAIQSHSVPSELENLSDTVQSIACQSIFDTLDSTLAPRPLSVTGTTMLDRIRPDMVYG